MDGFQHRHTGASEMTMRKSAKLEGHQYIPAARANLAGTVLTLTKDVAEMLQDVPYVKAVAGVILQIIQVKEV
jgi:hypothetical protein